MTTPTRTTERKVLIYLKNGRVGFLWAATELNVTVRLGPNLFMTVPYSEIEQEVDLEVI